jgi:hypothetical protein
LVTTNVVRSVPAAAAAPAASLSEGIHVGHRTDLRGQIATGVRPMYGNA